MPKQRLTPASLIRDGSWMVFLPSGLVLVTLIGALTAWPLFQRQINARWIVIVDAIEPGRSTVGDIQVALAREMAAVRAYALTGDPVFVGRYQDLLATERDLFEQLRSLVLSLSPAVDAAHHEFERLTEEWHQRPTEAEMLARVLDPAVYSERIPSEQETWDRLLHASEHLREALLEEEVAIRTAIGRLERMRLFTTSALVLLALVSAAFAAWLGVRIQQLRMQAEQRRREIIRLTENRANLIRGITHDVKNPLGVISGYAELLTDGVLQGAAASEAYGRIQEASRSALHLIDDLLELSLADAGQLRLHWEAVQLDREVEAVVAEYAPAAAAAGLQTTLTVPDDVPGLRTDARRVRQILGNLLSNAIKYTPVGGAIHIRVAAAAIRDRPAGVQRLAIHLTDTGPGIPEAKREEIFQEFSRLEPGAERGTGLGLAISRKIARALGGDITVASAEGDGSRFTLWLPLQPPDGAESR